MNQRTLVVVAVLAALAQPAHGADHKARGELGFGYDSNVANARQGGSDREAGFALLRLGADKLWALGSHNALQGRIDVESQAYARYQDLDSAKGTLLLRHLFRPGAGFFMPTLALSGSASWWEFNSSLRDSADYRASAFVHEQLTTRISARLTGGVDWRRAREQDVFTLRTRSLGVDLDWMLGNRFAIYGGYQRRWGQFATTRPTAPAPSFTFAPDDAFPGEFATRQEGAADIGSLGFNLAFSQRLALDVQGFFVEAGANTGVHYRRMQAMASLLARF